MPSTRHLKIIYETGVFGRVVVSSILKHTMINDYMREQTHLDKSK